MLNALFHYCSAVFVHSSLGGVLIQRRGEFEDEHKPQIWSGRTPCYDKDGNVKVVSLMRGFKCRLYFMNISN